MAAQGVRALADGSNPQSWDAELYAGAGYLADAARIPDVAERGGVLDNVRSAMSYVNDPPPIILSPVPAPRAKAKPNPPWLPEFPMTAEGFRAQPPAARRADQGG